MPQAAAWGATSKLRSWSAGCATVRRCIPRGRSTRPAGAAGSPVIRDRPGPNRTKRRLRGRRLRGCRGCTHLQQEAECIVEDEDGSKTSGETQHAVSTPAAVLPSPGLPASLAANSHEKQKKFRKPDTISLRSFDTRACFTTFQGCLVLFTTTKFQIRPGFEACPLVGPPF